MSSPGNQPASLVAWAQAADGQRTQSPDRLDDRAPRARRHQVGVDMHFRLLHHRGGHAHLVIASQVDHRGGERRAVHADRGDETRTAGP